MICQKFHSGYFATANREIENIHFFFKFEIFWHLCSIEYRWNLRR